MSPFSVAVCWIMQRIFCFMFSIQRRTFCLVVWVFCTLSLHTSWVITVNFPFSCLTFKHSILFIMWTNAQSKFFNGCFANQRQPKIVQQSSRSSLSTKFLATIYLSVYDSAKFFAAETCQIKFKGKLANFLSWGNLLNFFWGGLAKYFSGGNLPNSVGDLSFVACPSVML